MALGEEVLGIYVGMAAGFGESEMLYYLHTIYIFDLLCLDLLHIIVVVGIDTRAHIDP